VAGVVAQEDALAGVPEDVAVDVGIAAPLSSLERL
jgi:hypothetical protein